MRLPVSSLFARFVQIKTRDLRISNPVIRQFCKGSSADDNPGESLLNKYKIFREEESPIIFDVEEERKRIQYDEPVIKKDTRHLDDFNLERGSRGVYNIEDLVDLINRDKAKNVFVVRVPEEMNYVDYMVIATCKTKRHLLGLAELVIRMYKKKRHSTDSVPNISSENSDWLALDLGNIVLHLMLGEVRERYDLESLWSVGADFDTKANQEDEELLKILEKHNLNLEDLRPVDRLG